MRFLVVDDSSTMRRIITNIVAQLGVEKGDIFEAEDGRVALKILESGEKIDIVLTDWNMPNMNGLDLVKAIRENINYGKLPILMITTEGGKTEVINALKAGVNNYIIKPFNADTLKEKIHPFLKK